MIPEISAETAEDVYMVEMENTGGDDAEELEGEPEEESYQIEGGEINFSQSFLDAHGVGGAGAPNEEEKSIAQVEKEIEESIQRRKDDLERDKKALQDMMKSYFNKVDKQANANYEEKRDALAAATTTEEETEELEVEPNSEPEKTEQSPPAEMD